MTLAKSKEGADFGIPAAVRVLNESFWFPGQALVLDKVVLYEKCPGDAEYHVHTVVESETR